MAAVVKLPYVWAIVAYDSKLLLVLSNFLRVWWCENYIALTAFGVLF